MPFGERFEHESYGMIGISNVSCRPGQALFGSSIKHDRYISLRIKHAVVERDLHKEWYFAKEPIVEINLSAAQFAEFITTPNTGDGVPCTIKHINMKQMTPPPYRGQNEQFSQELDGEFEKAMKDAEHLIRDAREALNQKGAMKVADKKELLGKLESLVQHIESNMPFLHKQFTRAMDKTVSHVKAEIEAFYTSTIMKFGKKAIENGITPDKIELVE